METVLIGLLASSPSAVVAIAVIILFLRYMREERTSWRDAVDNNSKALAVLTQAMTTQTLAMGEQANAIRSLHVAVSRLEEGKEDKNASRD